jgi:flagellar biosynthesis anti-sigma factor FlgM
MKVNGTQPRAGLDRVSAPKGSPGARGGVGPTSAGAQQVQVSTASRALASARAPETPDEARISALREAIASGTFKVDPELIADRMLREER